MPRSAYMAQRGGCIVSREALLFNTDDIPEIETDPANEWYTPALLIEAARLVMDSIELDPASTARANLVVRAERYFTQKENGLAQDWTCRSLFINPPYGSTGHLFKKAAWQGQSIARMFLDKLKAEYDAGRVGQAIALVKADPKSSTFQPLWSWGPICFCRDRIYFDRPHKRPEKIQFGTSLVYLGDPEGESRFIDVFRAFGRVARAVDTPPPILATNDRLWHE